MRASEQTLNRLRVLKAIRRQGPISRSELPRLTGLSGGTITQLTADLVDRGLILETKDTERRAGRPRTHLAVDADAGMVIGASIRGVGNLATRFVDLLGRELFAYDAQLKPARTLEKFMSNVADCIAEAIERSPYRPTDLTRIALALPGMVDSERGTLHFMTTFPLGPVPAAAIVSEGTGVPVTIENEQACAARAIHWFGPDEHLDTFTHIHVGYAVTTAEYADGLPKSGASGLNPEIGHMKAAFGENARPCFCGGRGCVSAYCSIYGLLAQTELLEGFKFPAIATMDPLFETFLDRVEAGEPHATGLLAEAAEHLGIAVANYLTASDPGTVLISVANSRLLAMLATPFWSILRANTMPGVLPATDVRLIDSDPAWGSNGTAALALEQTYLDQAGEDRRRAAALTTSCRAAAPGRSVSIGAKAPVRCTSAARSR